LENSPKSLKIDYDEFTESVTMAPPNTGEPPNYPELLDRVYRAPDGARRAEQIVIRLLTRHLSATKLTLEVNEGSGFDAVAPGGIDSTLPGPTIVDITQTLKRTQSPRFIPDLLKAIDGRGANSVLFVATRNLRADRMRTLASHPRLQEIPLKFWGPSEIAGLLERFPDAVGGLVPDLAPQAVAAIVQQADSDWTERRKKHVSELRRVYFSDRLSLFIGAGASMDCGIPSWKNLINQLALQMVDEQTPKDGSYESRAMTATERLAIASALVNSQDGSPLLVGRYLETSLGTQFTSKLQQILYSAAKEITSKSLITAVARLCRPSRQREGIYAVVTYNFDDLLETALNDAEIKCRPIYQEGAFPDSDELPIYHVHGRLPRTPGPDGASQLVFSEESYFALQSDHYSWANFEQLKLLRDTTCLLIGLSGTDPNLRRLLDIDFRQSKRAKHYICLKRQKVSDLLGGIEANTVRSSVAEHFLNVHHSFLDHSFADLGLNVIWVNEFEDVPGLLQDVRTHEGP
jgi:hypothetical protein